MSDFTIEQLEALKGGKTPGTWCATDEEGGSDLIIDETGESLLSVGSIAEVWASFSSNADGKIAAAAPALVDALIAEKRAHAKLRAEVEELRDALATEFEGPHYEGDYGDGRYSGLKQATAFITRILEADNE